MPRPDWRKIVGFSALGGLCGMGVWAATRPSTTRRPEPEPQPQPKPSPGGGPFQPVVYPPEAPPAGGVGHCSEDVPLKPLDQQKRIGVFPVDTQQRNQFIVDAVAKNLNDPIEWTPMFVEARGHKAVFQVMSDSLRIGGVRVCASAATTQKVADLLGASLLTPTLADALYLNAGIRLPVMNRLITNKTEDMIDQSKKIDAAIQAQLAPGEIEVPLDTIIANQGKNWVISPRLIEQPADPFCHLKSQGGTVSNLPIPKPIARSCNYGWHKPGTSDNTGIPRMMVDGKQYDVVQGQGICHDICHDDYSQLICLVKNECWVDDQPMNIQTLLLDPELAWLASARTGAYPKAALRLQGVPPRPPRQV